MNVKVFKSVALTAISFIVTFYSVNASAQSETGTNSIRLNQIGFYPNATKIAIITNAGKGDFYIRTLNKKTVFTGQSKPAAQLTFGGKQIAVADFTAFAKNGTYLVYIPLSGYSYPFTIAPSIHKSVAGGSIKAFYYQRASVELIQKYAGKWHRAAGHPDNRVLIHSSAATAQRPESTVVSASGGWYDAGDYNKYIVNSGISTATLLSLYEDFPDHMKTVRLNIPESDNQIPDVLDEVLWNLRWMLMMQDPNDGGVYHKLTNARFDGMIMPEKAIETRYVVQKSTAATLDFAAVTAQAARIFARFRGQLPGLADSCLKASELAYTWASKNPDV
ncbi:glycoside hydrolase family 9 protein, partial [Mucilaginibacter sp.]|uniref:glycoside hydrolase family 9 protein n=1 Tax=Mucilaginibacter sp. TaxID=1882438 RepID=UPI0035BC0D01